MIVYLVEEIVGEEAGGDLEAAAEGLEAVDEEDEVASKEQRGRFDRFFEVSRPTDVGESGRERVS